MSVANPGRSADVQAAEQHFNSSGTAADAAKSLIQDVQNILKSSPDAKTAQTKLAQLNEDLQPHMAEKGLPNLQIFGAANNDLILGDKDHSVVLSDQAQQKFEGSSKDAQNFVANDGKAAPSKDQAEPKKDAAPEKAEKTDAAPGASDTRNVTINKGDTLWKIAKKDLPEGASNTDVLKHMRDIADLNNIPEKDDPKAGTAHKKLSDFDHIYAGEPLKLPPKSGDADPNAKPEGTKSDASPEKKSGDEQPKVTHDGDKTTSTYKDGTVKEDDGHGTVKTTHPDKSVDEVSPTGTKHTNSDGTYTEKNKDGTGAVKTSDGYTRNWGPKAEDNYETSPQGDKVDVQYGKGGEAIRTRADGTVATSYPDGTEKVEDPTLKSGSVKHPDGSEHHWGKLPDDNFDKDTDGTIVPYVDGVAKRQWPDGTVREQHADGTGFVKHPDNSTEHWGPQPKDNYSTDKDGFLTKETNSDGSVTDHSPAGTHTVSKDSIVDKNYDGTAGTSYDLKNHTEHHWGTRPTDNYDMNPSGGITIKDANGNSRTEYGSFEVQNKDGSGATYTQTSAGHWKVVHRGTDGKEDYEDNVGTSLNQPAQKSS